MKKIIWTAFVGPLIAGAFAQSTSPAAANTGKQKDMKDMRKDVREVRHDKKLRTYELKHHDKADAMKGTRDIKGDKRGIKRMSKI